MVSADRRDSPLGGRKEPRRSVLLCGPILKPIHSTPDRPSSRGEEGSGVKSDFISVAWALDHWWGHLDLGAVQG